MGRWLVGAALIVCGTGWSVVSAQEAPRFRRAREVAARLAGWARRHPQRAKLLRLGKSAGGRALLALRVARRGPVDPDRRPAVFVGANIAGDHHLGTEAALHLLETALADGPETVAALGTGVTLYVAPLLNPDAHEARFAAPARASRGNAAPLDRDRDGQTGEDLPDDLNGDGRITVMRIPDPTGRYLPDPLDPRAMVEADPLRGERGRFRLVVEGKDDDGDGRFNEEAGGIEVDRNFAHAWPYPAPEAGPWPSAAPEAKHAMDFLLARRNVALAVVLGPGNTLRTLPPARRSKAPAASPSGGRRRRGRTTPVTSIQAEDAAVLAVLAEGYGEALKAAGQDPQRKGAAPGPGGFTPWLYFHYGVLAVELDVWGLPGPAKPKRGKPPAGRQPDEKKQPDPRKTPDKQKAKKAPKPDPERARARAALAYLAQHRPGAIVPWTAVTLPDGRRAEVGGLDPFAASTPPAKAFAAALAAHTRTILGWCGRLARVELSATAVRDLGGGVYELKVTCRNAGFLPTHTQMAVIGRTKLPVRLELDLGKSGARVITGRRWRVSERLAGSTGTLQATWLVRAKPGTTVHVQARSQNAGTARAAVVLGGE